MCNELGLGKACRPKVENACSDQFGVTDHNRPVELDVYLIHINFDLIDDQNKRNRFQSIPTKLQLPKEDVDALIDIAPELMQEEPEFLHLLNDLGARFIN